MDKIKSFYHFVILSLLFLQIQSCTSDITISLGNGYFYRDEGDNLKDILCKNVNGVEVPATVINYVYDSKFILAKQIPKYPQDPLYNKEYEYKKGSDAVYFWIIDKSNNVQYGPLEKREYDKLRQKLRIPRNLQLNSTDNESEMQSNGQGYEYHLDFESMCELMEETEEKNIIKDTITDSDFDGLMQRYFREHLSYPKTGEEFCRKYYMKDKLNGYDYLMSTCDYAGHREDFVDPHLLTYQQYNELMDKLYEDIYQQYQNPLHPYYGLFMNNYSPPFILKPDWQYIYRSQSDITFSIEGDKLLMKNAADGRIFATENYLYTLPRYIEDMHGIPFDVRRITNLNELRQTYAYTSDSIQIELLQFYEYDDMNEEDIAYKIHIAYRIQKNINRLILKYNKSISNSVNIQSKKYILHYKKSGEMTDFFTGDPAPIVFSRNKELTSYLEHLMSLNPRIAFIQFEAFEIER